MTSWPTPTHSTAYRFDHIPYSSPETIVPTETSPVGTAKAIGSSNSRANNKSAVKPDAPLTRLGRAITAAVHASVLVGLIAFVATQLYGTAQTQKQRVVAEVVPSELRPAISPIDGIFHPARHLPAGTAVRRGDVLGWVESPEYQRRLDSTRNRLDSLYRRKLLVGQGRDAAMSTTQELRDICERIVTLQHELVALQTIGQKLCVISPTDGRIQGNACGEKSVVRNEELVKVWPESSELLLEVRGPLSVVHNLIKRPSIKLNFDTTSGPVSVSVQPLQQTLRCYLKTIRGQQDEPWGTVLCMPNALPNVISQPGTLGTL